MRAELLNAAWVDETFNPWVDAVSHWRPPSTGSLGDRVLGKEEEALRWNAEAEEFAIANEGRRRRVFAGPWCTVLSAVPDNGQRARFWELVARTPRIDWLVMAEDGHANERSLPRNWGKGYDNVWVGASITQIATTGAILACLREVPAKLRFVIASPTVQDLGDLDLRGIGWVVIRLGRDEKVEDPDAIASVRLQATYQGVPVWFDRHGSGVGEMAMSGGVFEAQESPRAGR